VQARPAFSPVALRSYLFSRRRLLGTVRDCEGNERQKPGGAQTRISESFHQAVIRNRVGTECECDCAAVHGTLTVSERSHMQMCVDESFNSV
jgi:hypothetical protein